ncbi:MAG: LPS export ABC transporter permease LptG [Pseudomonadota bacterium]
MMLKLYIARKFCLMVALTFLMCAGLIFMIDFVELLRQSGKSRDVELLELLELSLLRLPAYTEILLTFAVLVGSIASLLMLSRKSELAVMRAGGMSVWGIITPCVICAFLIGVFATTVYNPIAAAARAIADEKHAVAFGKSSDFLKHTTGVPWLRQDGIDGPSIISAHAATDQGINLINVRIYQYDKLHTFVERINASKATLFDGYWLLNNVMVTRPGEHEPSQFKTYTISTYLSPGRVRDALGSIISLSFWEFPNLIDVVEKAGLSATGYHVQYQILLVRPLLLITMVFLAATVSLKSFRSGGIQTMLILGMIGGISFFLVAEVSRQIGVAGLISPHVAVWVPTICACLVTITILLYQEDG